MSIKEECEVAVRDCFVYMITANYHDVKLPKFPLPIYDQAVTTHNVKLFLDCIYGYMNEIKPLVDADEQNRKKWPGLV